MTAKDRWIAASLIAAIAGSVLFIVAYATGGDRLYEGLALAFASAGFAAAAAGWAFWILPPEEVVDQRSNYPSPPADRFAQSGEIATAEREITRRRVLTRLLYAALGAFGLALIVPIRSLGNGPGNTLFHTKWRRGLRLTREDGRFIHVSELNVDSVVTVFPQNAVQDSQSQTLLIRLPESIEGTAQGYIAYSKICTHAGCPVALYRASAKELMCPCHQSIFNVTGDGAVVSGPADHALPRLPIEVDGDGYIVASGDFPEPVGPGFWERG